MNDKVIEGICDLCKHRWIVLCLPMSITKSAQLLKAAQCPRCGGKKVFVAEPQQCENKP